jgi:Fe2+ transport system protein FeoA
VVLTLADGEALTGEAAIVATPAAAAAAILGAELPAAAEHIRSIPHGSTAVVSLAYAPEQVPADLAGHGFLVADGEPLTIHACTLSSRKWAGRAPDGWLLARAFIGDGRPAASATDDELLEASIRDLATTLGLTARPTLSRVARYRFAMPHYTVGHLDRVAAASAALAETPQVVLAGGAYRGVGLPDCISQGRAAATRVAILLGGARATVHDSTDMATSIARPVPLATLPVGVPATVTAIATEHAAELALEGLGPDSEVVVATRAPLGGPTVIHVGRARIALPRRVANGVTVQPRDGTR